LWTFVFGIYPTIWCLWKNQKMYCVSLTMFVISLSIISKVTSHIYHTKKDIVLIWCGSHESRDVNSETTQINDTIIEKLLPHNQKFVVLSECISITNRALLTVAKLCGRHLITLHLADCYNINGKRIQISTTNYRRKSNYCLNRYLQMRGCLSLLKIVPISAILIYQVFCLSEAYTITTT
jgi:hypothetical protein